MTEEIAANEPLDIDADAPPRHDWRTLLTIGIGGAAGTTVRYAISTALPQVSGIPLGILLANITGAFLIGVLIESLALRGDDTGRRRRTRLLLGTGFLGGYTTYSAIAADTTSLLETGRIAASLGYGLVTVVGGGAATWTGIVLARAVERGTTVQVVTRAGEPSAHRRRAETTSTDPSRDGEAR